MRTRGLPFVLTAFLIACAECFHAGQAAADASAPNAGAKTVAVLDFRDLGPSVELQPLRKALARMLTTDLSAYGQIKVVARERIDRMLRETNLTEAGLVSPETAQKAGRAVAADFLVQGTFAGFSSRIDVHLEVLDVAAGRAISSADLSGLPTEVLEIEAKLLAAVTKALDLGTPVAQPAPTPGAKPTTVAVLYFQNLSPDAHLDPMEIGFADLLITYLQDRQRIAVVEREKLNRVLDELGLQESALAQSGSAPRIGQMLGAQTLLLGSFLSVGKTLRFDAHLVAADTGALMQAVSVHGPTDNIDPLLRSLADKVASALTSHPRTADLPKRESKTSIEAMLHYSRAVALEKERRYTEAADEYQRALYLCPDSQETMARLADVYYSHLKDYQKAAELYESLMAGPYRKFGYGNQLAWCYYRLGQPDRQIAVLKGMLYDPIVPKESRGEVAFLLGNAYDLAGKVAEAKDWYELGLKMGTSAGTRANIRGHLAYYFANHAKEQEAAAQQYEAIILEAPREDARIRRYFVDHAIEQLSGLYEQALDYERAQRVFGQVITKFARTPEAAQAQLALAKVAATTGRVRDAAEAFVHGAEAAPQLRTAPEALVRAASLFSGPLGDPKRGTELARQAIIRYGPDHRTVRNAEEVRKLPPESRIPFVPHDRRPVLIDEAHNEASVYYRGQHEQFGLWAALIEAGQWVHVNETRLSHRLLAGYSVLILNSTYEGATFANEEIEAIRSLVATGGGLLLNLDGRLGAGGHVCYLQYGPLMTILGVGPSQDTIPATALAAMSPKRPALTAINRATVAGGTALGVPEDTVVATCEGHPVLAALRFGLGRLVLSGLGNGLRDTVMDSDWPTAEDTADNRALACAAVEWLRGDDSQSQVKRDFEAAFRKLATGDEAGALAALRRIAADNPGTRWAEEARLRAGDLLRSKGDVQAASAEYQHLVSSATEPQVKALARLNLARCHAAGEGPGIERAVAECWNVWREDQSNPWAAPALIQGGKWAFEAGNLEAAQKAFDTVMNAREHGMDKLWAMLWGALCRERRNDPTGAARIYRAVAEEYPPIRVPPDLPRPAKDRSWDVQEYARARAAELAP